MSERAVLASCLASRDAWVTVTRHASPEELGEQGKIVLAGISDFYTRDPAATHTDPELVLRGIQRGLSNPKHKEQFATIVKGLAEMDVSPPNVVQDLLAVKREAVGNELATALTAGKKAQEVRRLLDRYAELADAETLGGAAATTVLNDIDLVELVATTFDPEKLIRVWPRTLNERLGGGALRGHHVIVFARPEMGKTATLINMVAGFCAQGLRTLYVSNEEPVADLNMRLVSRLTRQPKPEVTASPEECHEIAREKGYANVYWGHLHPGSPREIEALAEEVKPDVLVVDQLRNLHGDDDNFVRRLEGVAAAVRAIGQRQECLVVSATQAGDSASGKAVLEMSDVDSSKTGIPAQADVMIGLGATDQDIAHNRRVMSLCKNKLSGDHGFFPVKIVPAISQLRSLG